MKTFILKGKNIKKVGFFGFGQSNRSVKKLLENRYQDLSYTLRSDSLTENAVGFENVYLGERAYDSINEDVLFISPGVRHDRAEFQEAKNRGVLLSSDIELFLSLKNFPVLAVTGSDGKSSTVTLASMMLTKTLGTFPPCANIGVPACDLLEVSGIVGSVMELSSFQLMSVQPTSRRALITNVSKNHLDWHTDMEEYISAKENVLKRADERVFNLDCPISSAFISKYGAYAAYSLHMTYKDMRRICNAKHYFYIDKGVIFDTGEPLLNISELSANNSYNVINFMAAAALTSELASQKSIANAAKSFIGLAHRAELVATYDGIKFYDSSIDTTPTRTKTTLSSLKERCVLILGGRSKGTDFSDLFPITKNLRAVVITGENAKEIRSELFCHSDFILGRIPVYYCARFDDAILRAIKAAKVGDAVLLSPASASFDRFKSYIERGKYFSNFIENYYHRK